MKTQTKATILQLVQEKGQVKPSELVEVLGFNATIIHRHLKDLVSRGDLTKIGSPPRVFYVLRDKPAVDISYSALDSDVKAFLEKYYLYVTPLGSLLYGVEGFAQWVKDTKQTSMIDKPARRYMTVKQEAMGFFNNNPWVDATTKFTQTFVPQFVDQVFYQDFYSLPEFGKTKLGQLVLHAKQAQHKGLIKDIAQQVKPVLEQLIETKHVQATAFIPHSLPRQVPFLKYLRSQLELSLPNVDLVKAYVGEVPVAQKSLSKLEERVLNAKESIFIKNNSVPYETVLLIDDAVGSGATFQETARKLKQQYQVKKVYGFAIVGSYKGFEVIREV